MALRQLLSFALLAQAYAEESSLRGAMGSGSTDQPVVNSTNMILTNFSSADNDSMLESAWGGGTKVICPGFGFSSAACYGTLQTKRPSVIVAWSGGTSTAALGYALHPSSASAFAAWVVTHPDYTWSGTAYEFYKNALSGSAFSFLNSKLYIGMGCGAYYYLLHDFASSEDMAKALATSGGETFTGYGRVNGVNLANCQDNFGLGSAWKGALGYSTGQYVNVLSYVLYSTSSATAVQSLVNSAWSDSTQYSTTQNFQSANCLCTKNGCNFGC